MATCSLLQEKDYPLLKRKNVLVRVDFPNKPTPSMKDIKKEVTTFLKGEENRVAVKHIKQEFGKQSALVTIYLYHDEKALKDGEEIKKRKKKEGEQQSGQEAQAKK